MGSSFPSVVLQANVAMAEDLHGPLHPCPAF